MGSAPRKTVVFYGKCNYFVNYVDEIAKICYHFPVAGINITFRKDLLCSAAICRAGQGRDIEIYMYSKNNTEKPLRIRALSLLLALLTAVACLVCLPGEAAALASNDYVQWRQDDPEWNSSPAWPGGWTGFLAKSGCWVTSISMLLRQYGFVSGNMDEFNPWICCGILAEHGALNGNGDMVLSLVGAAFPGFDYAGDCSYSLEALREKLFEGYACAILVNDGGHMVAVRGVLEDGTVVIMDPGSDRVTLDEYGDSAATIIYFGPV